jgi:hypothetical protein
VTEDDLTMGGDADHGRKHWDDISAAVESKR